MLGTRSVQQLIEKEKSISSEERLTLEQTFPSPIFLGLQMLVYFSSFNNKSVISEQKLQLITEFLMTNILANFATPSVFDRVLVSQN